MYRDDDVLRPELIQVSRDTAGHDREAERISIDGNYLLRLPL